VLGATPQPEVLSSDFEVRLAARLREAAPAVPRQGGAAALTLKRRRWLLRFYWIGAAVVALAIDPFLVAPEHAGALAMAAALITLVLQRLMRPWSLGHILRSALR
jgi:hypothetical protein